MTHSVKRKIVTALLLCGIFWIIYDLLSFRDANSSLKWPSTKGKILHSVLEAGRGGWRLSVMYEYRVGQSQFQNDVIKVGMCPKRDQKIVKEMARKFSTGSIRSVYYDPEYPSNSVLITGYDECLVLDMYASVIYTVIALFIQISVSRSRKSVSATDEFSE